MILTKKIKINLFVFLSPDSVFEGVDVFLVQ